MPYLLDAVYVCLLILYSPVLLYKSWKTGKYRDGWAAKLLGRAPRRIGDRPCLWFHAVSVGEVRLLRPLIEELARRRPEWEVVVSSTTPTGLALARRDYPDLVTFYFPLDFSWAVRRAVSRVRPTVLALVELELWPNLIRAAHASGSRVSVINGRLSARSHRGYRRIRWAIGPTLWRIDGVAAQTDEYAARFVDIGIPAERVLVTGSVKYDGLEAERGNTSTIGLRRDLGLSPSNLVFVAGSTMEGEESAALSAYRSARADHPTLRLILVPRHAERFEKVAKWLLEQGERVVRRSRPGEILGTGPTPPIYLIDTIGELSGVWGLADVAFVGGSLFPGRGGQNMMEPAAYGASVLFGPHTENFKEAVEGLIRRDAARRVKDVAELEDALRADLDDPEAANLRGQAARDFVLAQNGASSRTLAELDRLVGSQLRGHGAPALSSQAS